MLSIESRFLNNDYKVLEIINENQFKDDNNTYCPLTQEEIAKRIGCSRITINSILKRLKKDGFITQNPNNKRYSTTQKSLELVKKIKKINWEGE